MTPPSVLRKVASCNSPCWDVGGCGDSRIPITAVNDGRSIWTFVSEELVYAYAMWVSPGFTLKVIRALGVVEPQPRQQHVA